MNSEIAEALDYLLHFIELLANDQRPSNEDTSALLDLINRIKGSVP